MFLFFPCVVLKSTAHVDTKVLNVYHQSQKGFCGNFVGIPQHQKGYLVYLPSIRKIVSSHDVVFDKTKSSVLAYKSFPSSEAISMQPSVSHIPYATSSHKQTGGIINFHSLKRVI